MPKKENLGYLANVHTRAVKSQNKEPTIALDDFEALLTWVFGSDERTIAVCARVAFSGAYRGFRGFSKMPKPNREAWREDTERLIAHCVEDFTTRKLSGQEAVDAWHKEACTEIRELSSKHNALLTDEGFTYGLAQLPLNLTIQNMRLMERWDDLLDPIGKYLHIPVNSKIIKSASENLGTPPRVDDSKPWSGWDYGEYINFQEAVRNAVPCPMDWCLAQKL